MESNRNHRSGFFRDLWAALGGPANYGRFLHREQAEGDTFPAPSRADQERIAAATLVLRALHSTILPLQARAVNHADAAATLRPQDNIPLDFQIYMAAHDLRNAVVISLNSVDDLRAKEALKALSVPDPKTEDFALLANAFLAGVERALRVLMPIADVWLNAFKVGERLPNEGARSGDLVSLA